MNSLDDLFQQLMPLIENDLQPKQNLINYLLEQFFKQDISTTFLDKLARTSSYWVQSHIVKHNNTSEKTILYTLGKRNSKKLGTDFLTWSMEIESLQLQALENPNLTMKCFKYILKTASDYDSYEYPVYTEAIKHPLFKKLSTKELAIYMLSEIDILRDAAAKTWKERNA